MIYIALWDAPDEPRRPRSVLEKPAVRRLGENWGRGADFGLAAIDSESEIKVGAVWTRLDRYENIDGFGCDYPFLGIAVVEEYQCQGVGTFLLNAFIEALQSRVDGLRLGVNPRNARAIHLYEKFGFKQYVLGAGGYPQMKLDFENS